MSNFKINEMKNILNRLIQHEILTKEEAKDVLVNISSGSYNPSQIAAFMTVYMMRSITIEELAGFREALLELCIPVDFSTYNTIDLCGTGGDGKDTFNISTLASFIVAGAGIKVAKHGNYGVSSISGSSNVMEKMGVKFTNDSDFLTKSIEKTNIEEIETLLKNLKDERDNMGAVNLRADDETKNLENQINKMMEDRKDLLAGILKLKSSINELNQKGREKLIDAYEKVGRKFNDVYTKLFGGGNARLELIESDDPLEAGLELLVSPPGKKLQSITLLSGGEQALTAMALIFAVFLINPAPICILDEVDAPLDDANVTRFCSLIEELTKITETKFIVITHHALTMSRMNRLYGVTMAERGVSQLVAVDLEKAEEMVA